MATISLSYKRIGSAFESGTDCYGDIRVNAEGTGDNGFSSLGGSGTGSSYLNSVFCKFSSLSLDKLLSSAILSIAIDLDKTNYKNGDVNLTFYGCSEVTDDTDGLNMPTLYTSNTSTGTITAYPSDGQIFSFDITVPLNEAISNGSKYLYISASAGNNRKAIGSMTLTYEDGSEIVELGVRYNKQPVTSGLTWKQQLVSILRVNGITIFPLLEVAATQPTSAMTSNTAPSPYRVYYSSRYSTSYAAWRAFRNTIDSNGWASGSANYGKTAWIALDLGEGNKMREVKVSLWNRNNSNVNGAYNVTIYGTNTTSTSSDTSTIASMPSDSVILGTFTGLDGDTKSAGCVMDTVGEATYGCTRSGSYVANSKNNGFRYIIVSSTSWNTDGGNYLAIGRINIDGKFEVSAPSGGSGTVSGDNLIDTIGYTDGYRLSSSSGNTSSATGYTTVGYIETGAVGTVYKTSGVNFDADDNSNCYIVAYNSSKSMLASSGLSGSNMPRSWQVSNGQTLQLAMDSSGNLTITVNAVHTSTTYFRICGYGSGANLVITKS